MDEVAFLLGGARTPFANQGKILGAVEAEELAAAAVHHALALCGRRTSAVTGVIVATDFHACGVGRLVACALPDSSAPLLAVVGGGLGSGLLAMQLAARAVATDEMDLVLVIGCDSASTAPHFLPRSTLGARLGHGELLSSVVSARTGEAGAPPIPSAELSQAAAPSSSGPSATITTGTNRKPVVVDEDEEASEEWSVGDGAAALLVGSSGTIRMRQFACASSMSAARAAVDAQQLPAFVPQPIRPAPPGAAALACVLEAFAGLDDGEQAVVALAGQQGAGYQAVRLER